MRREKEGEGERGRESEEDEVWDKFKRFCNQFVYLLSISLLFALCFSLSLSLSSALDVFLHTTRYLSLFPMGVVFVC